MAVLLETLNMCDKDSLGPVLSLRDDLQRCMESSQITLLASRLIPLVPPQLVTHCSSPQLELLELAIQWWQMYKLDF